MADANENIAEDGPRILPLKVRTATAALIDVMDQLKEYPDEYVRFCGEMVSRMPKDMLNLFQVIIKPVWVSKILRRGVSDSDWRDMACVEIFSSLAVGNQTDFESRCTMSRIVIDATNRFLTKHFSKSQCVQLNPDRWTEFVTMPMSDFKERYLEKHRSNWKLRLLINENKLKFDSRHTFQWPYLFSCDVAVIVIGYSSRGSGSQFKLPHFWVFSVSHQSLPQAFIV
jgi:hypothetical protein